MFEKPQDDKRVVWFLEFSFLKAMLMQRKKQFVKNHVSVLESWSKVLSILYPNIIIYTEPFLMCL